MNLNNIKGLTDIKYAGYEFKVDINFILCKTHEIYIKLDESWHPLSVYTDNNVNIGSLYNAVERLAIHTLFENSSPPMDKEHTDVHF